MRSKLLSRITLMIYSVHKYEINMGHFICKLMILKVLLIDDSTGIQCLTIQFTTNKKNHQNKPDSEKLCN